MKTLPAVGEGGEAEEDEDGEGAEQDGAGGAICTAHWPPGLPFSRRFKCVLDPFGPFECV